MTDLIRRARGFVRHRWHTKEYIVYHRALQGLENRGDDLGGNFRFFVVRLEDVPWMTPHLSEWAKWATGGREFPNAEPVLREQLNGEDFTVAAVENKPHGALVFIALVSRDNYTLRLLGDAFKPATDVSVRRGWVSPNHRRMGIANAGMIFGEAESSRRGMKNMWNFVETRNIPSQGMHLKLGYRDVGRARLVRRPWGRTAGVRLDPATRWQNRPAPKGVTYL